MMSEQSALTYISRSRGDVLDHVQEFRDFLEGKMEAMKAHRDDMPPSAYLEAQRLMGLCNTILSKLEGF